MVAQTSGLNLSGFTSSDIETDPLNVRSKADLGKSILFDLLGISAARVFLSRAQSDRADERPVSWTAKSRGIFSATNMPMIVRLAVFHGGGLTALYWANILPFYLVYIYSLASLYPVMNRIRVYGQHLALAEDGTAFLAGSQASRTIDAGLADRVLFGSRVMMYHHEHHVRPGLPWRALQYLNERGAKISADIDLNCYSNTRFQSLVRLYRDLN